MIDHGDTLRAIAAKLEQAYAERDRAIIAVHTQGMKVTHIAKAVGLTRAQVHRIIAAHEQLAE